jgi:hypothetical protein
LPGAYIDDFHVYGRRAEPLQDSIHLKVTAVRKREDAWLVSKTYGDITIELENPAKVSQLTVYRMASLFSYIVFEQVPLSEIQDGRYILQDAFLSGELTYTYVAVALDADGEIIEIANSTEI